MKAKAIVEITDEKSGKGAKRWGYAPRLKGWIALDWTKDYIEPEKTKIYRILRGTEFEQVGAFTNLDYAKAEQQRRIRLGEAVKIVEAEG